MVVPSKIRHGEFIPGRLTGSRAEFNRSNLGFTSPSNFSYNLQRRPDEEWKPPVAYPEPDQEQLVVFISHCHLDQAFAQTLTEKLEERRISSWYAPQRLRGGEKMQEQIATAIENCDRVLLVLSEASMSSNWVQTEIRWAHQTELVQDRRKLFPIRLTSIEEIRRWRCLDSDTGKDLAVELREYFIPDFSDWRDEAAFDQSVRALVRDLRRARRSF